MPAPKIYNLHPLLAGPIGNWPGHLERVQAMAFDWLYVNAFFEPGASGSIYAVRDPWSLHPRVRGDADEPMRTLVLEFANAASRRGLDLMTDLILPHAAQDSRLVENHRDWFKPDFGGTLISPALANAADPYHPRRMADLAELELKDWAERPEKLAYFVELARHLLDLGIKGFRCSAAYKVPPGLWSALIAEVRRTHPDTIFLAAALGCPFEQVMALENCGFDFVFDSSRWWDFHERWFLEQNADLRRVAATVAFPEDHNTGRLAAAEGAHEPEEIARLYRARYLAAIGLGDGVLMPMGFEYGFRRPLDPVATTQQDWEDELRDRRVDLCDFIAGANRLKSSLPPLGYNAPQRRVSAPNARVVALLRHDAGHPLHAANATLLIANPSGGQADGIELGPLLTAAGGAFESFSDVTPGVPPLPFDPARDLTLDPLGVRIFGSTVVARRAPRAPSQKAAENRLRELAANRIVIEKVTPELDGGRFPVKRVVGECFAVEADIFGEGHDKVAAALKFRAKDESDWHEVPMTFIDNDRWGGSFPLTRNTRYVYTLEAWRDLFGAWRSEVSKKNDAGQQIGLELTEGRELVRRTAEAAAGEDQAALERLLEELETRLDDHGHQFARLLGEDVLRLMTRCAMRTDASRYEHELEVVVDRTAAAFAAWYELFPRSQSDDPNRHGTFDDVIRKLPYVRDMGFDVLYFPPVHPIGRTNRKGRNNSLTAQPGDPGSPYAIGAEEGGHDAIHPELGSFEDFRRLVAAAAKHGLEIAIDFAIQCAPDHPWIRNNPEWFDWRPDGTIKFAENPPKKYEDIVNVHFYNDGPLPALWWELRDVVLFWVKQGVKTFRVDNPHTKPFPFWEWMIREVQDRHPETVFLSEAFTRPKVMKRLAKVGFTQSYSYFTWRNHKAELTEYLTELTTEEPREHMRPNFFVNTPDINPVFLQTSGRAGFQIRAVLASTLSTLWGVYSGFELCEATPVPGKEEYLDSEKYEIKAWDWDRPGNIRDYIGRLNRIRRDNPALWQFANLDFINAWDDHVLAYTKITPNLENALLIAINLDPHHSHGCNFEVPLWKFGLGDNAAIDVEDLFTNRRFRWTGKVQHLWLDPRHDPCAIWRLVPPGLPA
jgi:starch synthase (maltosyl-transferring)